MTTRQDSPGLGTTAAKLRAVFLVAALVLLAIDLVYIPHVKQELPPVLPPAGEELPISGAFRFGVVGDTRGNPSMHDEIARRMKQDGVAFVLHLGDLARRRKPRQFQWLVRQIVEQDLQVPFCPVPGNHDILREPADGQERYVLYNRSFGPRHYWFACGDALFVAVDTAKEVCTQSELEWLGRTLALHRPRYKLCFVYMHVPVRNPVPGNKHAIRSGADEIIQLIQKWDVTAVFAGHIHGYAECPLGTVPSYLTAGGGEELNDPQESHHYLLCEVGADGAFSFEKRDVPDVPNRKYPEYVARVKLGREALRAASALLLLASLGCTLAATLRRRKQP